MLSDGIYAIPRHITSIEECFFYHTMEIPGHGVVQGEWDLRNGVHEYLGRVEFNGKRVLEIGTASGFLCFHMESRGAEVIAFDLSENQSWDIVPFSGFDYSQHLSERRSLIRRLNNSYWFCHRILNSRAKVVYGTVYSIPEEIGSVDIAIFGSVLLHLRDPFLALENALRLTRQTVIVTEVLGRRHLLFQILSKLGLPYMVFLPEYRRLAPMETWWTLPPEIIKRFIGVLGFEKTEVRYHSQKYKGQKCLLFTVVGHRTRDIRPGSLMKSSWVL